MAEWSGWVSGKLGANTKVAFDSSAGWVNIGGGAALPETPFIFERQRLPHARWLAGDDLDTLAATVAAADDADVANASLWTLHSFAPNPDTEDSRTREAQALERRVLSHLERTNPSAMGQFRPADRGPPPGDALVWQLCRVAGGVWSSQVARAELSDPYPGGIHRMPTDPLAPSRSYLKIEEALDVMRQTHLGGTPRPNETVVDLGAAPGGWTWAFVKRGCRVYAVDNGPLKLQSQGDMGGEAIHLREDGMRFRPQRPVDWLLSDMLIAPGQALGLLKRWLPDGWARHIVMNIKLPQADPLVALAPIVDYLRGVSVLRFHLRQLYHDRREVTLMGELSGEARSNKSEPAPPAQRRSRPKPPPRPGRRGATRRR